jgi:glucose/arabinose dehydrogenase
MSPTRWIRSSSLLLAFALPGPGLTQSNPVIDPLYAAELAIEAITAAGQDGGNVSQMTWGPPGPMGATRLFVATSNNGIHRFDYSPTGNLTQRVQISPYLALGIAFHHSPAIQGAGGGVLYLSEFRGTNVAAILRRLTDANGDGAWGGVGDIDQALVDNIPLGSIPYGHHMNQIQIQGDQLFVGIGVGSDLGDNENAYTGSLCWIEDLRLLDHDTTTDNLAGFPIVDFLTDPIPFTSNARDRLRVHSTGTRNPFGLAFDGDEQLWVTVNQIDVPRPGTGETSVPQDQLVRAFSKADYAFQDGLLVAHQNSVHDWRSDPVVLAAGFFAPQNRAISLTLDLPDSSYQAANPAAGGNPPHGLGPHSSADGFDFYAGNALPLSWHKDAFIARQSEQIAPPLGPYEDLVAVDLDTGEVRRVASGFLAPLDVLADAAGNLLIGEVSGSSSTRIYRVKPATAFAPTHGFSWAYPISGRWSDRSFWDCDLNGDGTIDSQLPSQDRKVPHAWGTARYCVTVSQPGMQVIEVDQPVVIETLTMAEALLMHPNQGLTVQNELQLLPGSHLAGSGHLTGRIINQGTVTPGRDHGDTGYLQISGRYIQAGKFRCDVAGRSPSQHDRLDIAGRVELGGTLEVVLTAGYVPSPDKPLDLVVADRLVNRGVQWIAPPVVTLYLTERADGREVVRLAALPVQDLPRQQAPP